MAGTLKTLQGEILVSEVEAVALDINLAQAIKTPNMLAKVIVIGKSGNKYDLATNLQSVIALKIYNAALNFVAGTGHATFDPAQVK